MSLTLNRDTVPGKRDVFAKVFELFTGGFAFTAAALARHTEGVTLPQGALLEVNEATRQCSPVKRARLSAGMATGATAAFFEVGHLFEVGDYVFVEDSATAGTITTIVTGDTSDRVTFGAAIRSLGVIASGNWAQHVATSTATGVTTRVTNANAIAAYPTTIEAGASVAALRRGTVYTNRVQPVVGTDGLPGGILFSTSS